MPKIFHVSTNHHPMWKGPKRYIRILLYDTAEELRKAAVKEHYNNDDAEPLKAVGMFTPPPVRLVYPGRNDTEAKLIAKGFTKVQSKVLLTIGELDRTPKHWGGLMRLCIPHLTHEVIAHECVHAAAAIYRMDITKMVVLGFGATQREEQFAYLTGDLTDGVMWVLRDHLRMREDQDGLRG